MNDLTSLLVKAAEEVRAYDNPEYKKGTFPIWLDELANDMLQASLISEKDELELTIHSLAYRLVDSGPLTEDFCPSFYKALGTVKRSRKRVY